MDEPLTEELLDELLDSPSPDEFIERLHIDSRSLSNYLQELLETHGLRRASVIRTSGINETYGYQLFSGQKSNPGRDKVLQLAFAMGLSLRETDRLLQAAGTSRLYCKNRRDAIVVFCLDRHATLGEVNEALYAHGEDILA